MRKYSEPVARSVREPPARDCSAWCAGRVARAADAAVPHRGCTSGRTGYSSWTGTRARNDARYIGTDSEVHDVTNSVPERAGAECSRASFYRMHRVHGRHSLCRYTVVEAAYYRDARWADGRQPWKRRNFVAALRGQSRSPGVSHCRCAAGRGGPAWQEFLQATACGCKLQHRPPGDAGCDGAGNAVSEG